MKPLQGKQHHDIVFVDHYELDASIGVFDWEKTIKQTLVFDLELAFPFDAAAKSDEITDAVSYAEVCETIDDVVGLQHYNLLEYLAERLSERIFECYPVRRLTLVIGKPSAIKNARNVGVKIFRERPE